MTLFLITGFPIDLSLTDSPSFEGVQGFVFSPQRVKSGGQSLWKLAFLALGNTVVIRRKTRDKGTVRLSPELAMRLGCEACA